MNGNNGSASYGTTYFNSFGVAHIPKETKKFKGSKSIMTNIYRIQTYNSLMYRYFCIGFIDSMLKGKSLLDYTNLFSPKKYEKSDEIVLNFFSITKNIKMKTFYCVICGKHRKFKNCKMLQVFEKTLVLAIICSNCENEDRKRTSWFN